MQLPEYFYTMWVAGRMILAKKQHPMELRQGAVPDCRPVDIRNAERKLVTRAYINDDLKETYIGILGPVQNGQIPRGISITVFGAQVALNARPDFGVIK